RHTRFSRDWSSDVCSSDLVRIEGGESIRLNVNSVIFASGGFQGSHEMMAKYIGRDAHKIPTVAEGGLYNKGEAISMMLRVGAKRSEERRGGKGGRMRRHAS